MVNIILANINVYWTCCVKPVFKWTVLYFFHVIPLFPLIFYPLRLFVYIIFFFGEKDLPENRLFSYGKRRETEENVERGCKWRAGVGIARIRREKSPPLVPRRQQAGNQQWANGWNQILLLVRASFFFFFLSLFSGAECLKPVKWAASFFSPFPLPTVCRFSRSLPFAFARPTGWT